MRKSVLVLLALLAACRREPVTTLEAPSPAAPAPAAPSPAAPSSAALRPAPAEVSTAAAQGRLPDGVRPTHYALQLEMVPGQDGFQGHVRIDLQLERPLQSLLLHARELQLTSSSLRVPGSERSVTAAPRGIGESGLLSLELSEPIGPGASRIEIDYTGKFHRRLRGLYSVESGGDSYAFTQFEPIDARRAFPCFDEPRFKTPFDLTLRVPEGQRAISNTPVLRDRRLETGRRELTFARTEPLPTYLIAFAVGPLDVVEAPPVPAAGARRQPLPLRGVAARGRGAELAFALQETPRLVASLERYFGSAFPYPKLDLIAVPDFASGAMENAGAITFRDTLLLLGSNAPEQQRRASISVNAHELAHQWFGDLVTMPWWDDIWLNEGFATWLAGRVVQDVHPEHRAELTRVLGLQRAFDMDAKRSARQVRQPIASDHDIRNAFDAITYTKGGALLEMFERYLGADAFRAGLRLYLERHRFGTGTSGELLAALEESAGKPVAAAFSTFLDQPGVPNVSATLECESGAQPRIHLQQSRFAPLGSGIAAAGLWQVPVCVRFAGPAPGQPAQEQCLLLDSSEATLTLSQRECPRWVFPNARASGYYRWSLATQDFAALQEHGYTQLDTRERLSLLSNTDASARAGAVPVEMLLRVALQVGKEPERELLSAALGVLDGVREALLGEAELPAYRRLLRELLGARQKQLGLFPVPTESGDSKLLRAELVSALALEGRDPALRGELGRLGRAQLGLGQEARWTQLSSELLEVALAVAVQEGGRPVMERVRSALVGSNDGIQRGRLLGALGHNLAPELSAFVLDVSLAPELRTNERLGLVLGQLSSPETRAQAYAWVEANFDALVGLLGADLGARLTSVAGAFCDLQQAERARAFLAPRVEALTGGPRLLRLNLEAAQACAAFAEAQRASAHAYFAAVRATP